MMTRIAVVPLLGMLMVLAPMSVTAVAAAGVEDIDVDAFMNETQKMSPAADRTTFAWWMPVELWEAFLSQDPTIAAADREAVLDLLRPYILVAASDGTMGPLGGTTFKPEAEVRASLKLTDASGRTHRPLAADALSPDVKNLLDMLKPMLANLLGALGENIHFFAFPAEDENGNQFVNPRGDGQLEVTVGMDTFSFKLPLAALVPPKTCPLCDEKLNGAYKFCPWDGQKLPDN
jgi:hypothetical protein